MNDQLQEMARGPKVLVVFTSQTGQMKDMVKSLCSDLVPDADIDFWQVQLKNNFPFPWKKYDTFFDAMPESVLGIPQEIEAPKIGLQEKYDLVILGYQPWYLSPSIPFNSFLKSEYASILKDTPVITLVGCRNMWLRAQEIVKASLINLGAKLVGNIVLDDKHPNIPSTNSVVRWMIKGIKEGDSKAPEAGVSVADVAGLAKYRPLIQTHLNNKHWSTLQEAFLANGAIPSRPELMLMEKNGAKQFPKWAAKAIKLGPAGDPARKPFLNKFKITLFVAIYILSPISSGLAAIKLKLQGKKMAKNWIYFSSVKYEPGKI